MLSTLADFVQTVTSTLLYLELPDHLHSCIMLFRCLFSLCLVRSWDVQLSGCADCHVYCPLPSINRQFARLRDIRYILLAIIVFNAMSQSHQFPDGKRAQVIQGDPACFTFSLVAQAAQV